MGEPRGDRLFVNLGASQTRQRLKGFGHGVRQVQTAGNRQAVIIHTATGKHLEALQKLFADVGSSLHEGDLSEPLENLRNLGPRSAQWLREAGLLTVADLRRAGPVLAFRMVREQQSHVSRNLLWALAAGLEDLDWRELSPEKKQQLLSAAEDLAAGQ